MTYQEWLENIKLLNNRQMNIEVLNKLENEPPNLNIQEMLVPKLEELITYRTNMTMQEVLASLELIFNDINELDYALVKFKKEISYIVRLIKIKQMTTDNQQRILNKFKEDINEVYNVLKKEADILDYTGSYSTIIKNNEYKWSE